MRPSCWVVKERWCEQKLLGREVMPPRKPLNKLNKGPSHDLRCGRQVHLSDSPDDVDVYWPALTVTFLASFAWLAAPTLSHHFVDPNRTRPPSRHPFPRTSRPVQLCRKPARAPTGRCARAKPAVRLLYPSRSTVSL